MKPQNKSVVKQNLSQNASFPQISLSLVFCLSFHFNLHPRFFYYKCKQKNSLLLSSWWKINIRSFGLSDIYFTSFLEFFNLPLKNSLFLLSSEKKMKTKHEWCPHSPRIFFWLHLCNKNICIVLSHIIIAVRVVKCGDRMRIIYHFFLSIWPTY